MINNFKRLNESNCPIRVLLHSFCTEKMRKNVGIFLSIKHNFQITFSASQSYNDGTAAIAMYEYEFPFPLVSSTSQV